MKKPINQFNKSAATKQAILLLINKLSGRIGKTQLVKLLFMADLQYYKQKKEQLTDLTYKFDHFGPYDKTIKNYLEELKNEKLITIEKKARSDEGYYFRYRAIAPNAYDSLDLQSYAILEETAEQYGKLTLDSLLETVYILIKKTQKGQKIDFEKIVGQA